MEYRCGNCGQALASRHVNACPACRADLSGIRCVHCQYVGSRDSFANDRCPKCGTPIGGQNDLGLLLGVLFALPVLVLGAALLTNHPQRWEMALAVFVFTAIPLSLFVLARFVQKVQERKATRAGKKDDKPSR